jgi:hypothetical protein
VRFALLIQDEVVALDLLKRPLSPHIGSIVDPVILVRGTIVCWLCNKQFGENGVDGTPWMLA